MARLPQPGGDDGNWGDILNDFLGQAHKTDGSLKNGIITSANLAANSVGINALGVTGGSDGQVLTKDSTATAGFTWGDVSGAATSVTMGGDISGSSSNAQIAAGAVGSAEIASQAVTASQIADSTITEAKLSSAVVTKLNAAGSGAIADGSIAAAKLNTGTGSNGQVLVYNSTAAGGYTWQTITTGSTTPTGAAGGALAGTYPNPTLADSAVTVNKLSISGTPTSGQVLSYNGAGFAWTNASTGAVTSVAGKTGAVTLAKADVGLGNIDNTSDANKPISSATQTALNTKANDTAVVHLTGAETVAGVKTFSSSPIVPTPTTTTQAANKSYVDAAVAAVPSAADATPTSKGIVQLAGDLSGTATSPKVTKVNGITISGTPSTGMVPTATSATTATWQTPSGGGSVGLNFTFRAVTADTTAANGECLMVNPTSNAITITLPTPVANAWIRVKRNAGNGNSIQVAAPSGYLLDANWYGTAALNNPYQSSDFWSDGTGWWQG